MADETTISDYGTNAPPLFRVTEEGDQTVIRAYDTNAPLWRINGKIGGGVEVMTTEERTAITPAEGELIYDTDLNLLFVGDGETAGGNVVAGGGGSGGIIPGYRLYTSGGVTSFNPVADIVNVTGTSVTLQPDTAYKILATTGAVNVTANPPAANKWGLEGHAEIFVGSVGYVVFDTSKIVLVNQLEPDSVNNCTLRFHDGKCIISVEDHVAGYIVVNGSTSGDGSLYYGITTSTNDYVAFDASLNGTTIPLAGAVAEGEKHIVGNGYAETTLTGAVDCGTSKFTVVNLGLNNVQVMGGVMTLGDAYIPSGSTVAVSGGGLAVEKVTGAGSASVIDLGGTHVVIQSAKTAYASDVQITGGSASNGGAFLATGTMHLESCVISGNVAATGGGIQNQNPVYLSNCIVSGNTRTGNQGRDIYPINSNADVILLGGNKIGEITLTNGAEVYLSGSNTADSVVARGSTTDRIGKVTLTSGAILDLTGNDNPTPIAPGGGITFESGGATVQLGSSAGTVDSSYMMDNVTLPAGAKLTNTNVINLGSANVTVSRGGTAYVSGCMMTGGSGSVNGSGGAFYAYDSSVLSMTDTTLTGNSAGNGTAIYARGAVELTGCTITDNLPSSKSDIELRGGQGSIISNCTIGTVGMDALSGLAPTCALKGSNVIGRIGGDAGVLTISSGAIVDLTGNDNPTPINPGGGIIVADGDLNASCTIINSAGSAVTLLGGTYSEIFNTGGAD